MQFGIGCAHFLVNALVDAYKRIKATVLIIEAIPFRKFTSQMQSKFKMALSVFATKEAFTFQ